MYKDNEHFASKRSILDEGLREERMRTYRLLHRRFGLIEIACKSADPTAAITLLTDYERMYHDGEVHVGELQATVDVPNKLARNIGSTSFGNFIHVKQIFVPNEAQTLPTELTTYTFANLDAYPETSHGMPEQLRNMEQLATSLEHAIENKNLPNEAIRKEFFAERPAFVNQTAA